MDNNFCLKSVEEMEKDIIIRTIFGVIIGIVVFIIELYIFAMYIVHWVQNDSLTFMQNTKWWFNNYYLQLIIVWVVRIVLSFYNRSLKDDKYILEKRKILRNYDKEHQSKIKEFRRENNNG